MGRALKRLRDMARLADMRIPRRLRERGVRLGEIRVPHQLKTTTGVRLAGAALSTAGLAFIGFGTLGAATVIGPIALTASGDVFVDTVNPPNNNGNEHDPHLPCENIFVFGDKLSTTSGTFTVNGIPPSAKPEHQDFPATGTAPWSGNTSGGAALIATIPVATLISNANANGDTPQANQGLHFKLYVSDGTSTKTKTFWVDCSAQVTSTQTVTKTVSGPTSTTTTTISGPTTTTTTTAAGTTTTTTAPGSTTTTTAPATTTTVTNATTVTATVTTTVPVTVTETTATVSVGTVTRTVTVPETVTRTVTTASNGTATRTVTHSTTVAAPTTKTQTKTVTTGSPGSSSSSPSSSTSTSSSTSSTRAGVQGASTSTPATGADLEFGGGLVLLVVGSGLVAFARRITGHKDG